MATGVENLDVFKSAFWLAMNVFEINDQILKTKDQRLMNKETS